VLSDLGDVLPQPLRHPSMWLANQRDDTLRAGIANRAPAGNLNPHSPDAVAILRALSTIER